MLARPRSLFHPQEMLYPSQGHCGLFIFEEIEATKFTRKCCRWVQAKINFRRDWWNFAPEQVGLVTFSIGWDRTSWRARWDWSNFLQKENFSLLAWIRCWLCSWETTKPKPFCSWRLWEVPALPLTVPKRRLGNVNIYQGLRMHVERPQYKSQCKLLL